MRYFSVLLSVVRDVLADKTRRQVSEQEVSACCDDLARQIRRSYEPNLIIAIGTGGSVPGELMAEKLGISIMHVIIRRNINIARRYSLDPIPLRWIMSLYHHFLFRTVKPALSEDIDVSFSDKTVLVVDDTIHTGATIDVIDAYLKRAGALDVKVAALSYVSNRWPDFYALPRGNYSFPWSRDYNPEP
jgi:hypoxanthine phosphoribosyltransferase